MARKLPTFHRREKLTVAIGRVGSGYTYCVQVHVVHVSKALVFCDRPYPSDRIVHRRRDEGITWARGWNTAEAIALRTVVRLREGGRDVQS